MEQSTAPLPQVFNKKNIPFLLLIPTFVWFLIFWANPVYNAIRLSFLDLEGNFTFINYIEIFKDAVFLEAVFNTFFIVIVSVFIEFVVAFSIALMINRNFKGSDLFLFINLLPMALAPVAVGGLWKAGFTTYGWVNSLLFYMGLIEKNEKIVFMTGEWSSAVLLIIVIEIWTVTPSVMVILLAGMQNFDDELKEAGTMFGASKWQVLWHITIPLLRPTIATAMIIRIIAALQIFGIVVLLFGYLRLPTLVEQLVYYYHLRAPENPVYEMRGLALSVLVSIIISVVVVLYLKITESGKG